MGFECFGQWKLESRTSPAAGRFVVATQDIGEGELLFCARAYLFALYETHRKQVCAFCARFSPHRLTVSCKGCDCVYYCSGACKDAHQRAHSHFCRVFARLPTRKFDNSTSATMYLLLEVAIRQLQADTTHGIDVPFVCEVKEEEEVVGCEEDKSGSIAREDPIANGQNDLPACVHTDALQGYTEKLAKTILSGSDHQIAISEHPEHTPYLEQHDHSGTDSLPPQVPVDTQYEPSLTTCNDAEHTIPLSQTQSTGDTVTEQAPNPHPDVLGLYVPCYGDFVQLCWSVEETERWGQAVRVVVDTLRVCGYTYTDEVGLRQHAARIENNGFGFFKTTGRKDVMVGVCVTPTASFFNHSCRPNAKSWGGSSMLTEFYAISDIKAGEEVCISYIDTEQSRSVRQKQLQDQYQFTCMCGRCEEEAGGQGTEKGRKGKGGVRAKGKTVKVGKEKRQTR